MTQFPVKKTRRNACRVKSWDTIEVHCVSEVSGVEMIESSNCKTWYHIPFLYFCTYVPVYIEARLERSGFALNVHSIFKIVLVTVHVAIYIIFCQRG